MASIVSSVRISNRPGDTGEADPAVTAALGTYGKGAGSEHDALVAIANSRLLVPVVAMLSERGDNHSAPAGGEKETEMALPTLVGNDGRTAVIAFTGIETIARWNPEARPVPFPAARVWEHAAHEGHAVVIDVAGPVPLVVEGARLAALAAGAPVPLPHEDPDVRAIVAAVTGDFDLEPGPPGTDFLLTLRSPDPNAVREITARVRATGRFRRGVAVRLLFKPQLSKRQWCTRRATLSRIWPARTPVLSDSKVKTMFRWLTAGESHGQALVAVCDGVPAGVRVTSGDVAAALARRRAGYGRGARMKFEQDEVELTGGVRHGVTLGGPVAIRVGNTEWPKWETIMSPDPVSAEVLEGQARNAPLSRPRPGHADLAGMQKYGFTDARPILERASARETAARVALGVIARRLLEQVLGTAILSHVVALGSVRVPPDTAAVPVPEDLARIDSSPVRCLDPAVSAAMVAEVDAARKDGDTLGGVVEVLAYGLPPGLGSHTQWDRKLDARLAGALMSVQAFKGVELGDGFLTAGRRGSGAHDEIVLDGDGVRRLTNRAGGVEGGMSTGETLRVRAAMKPISTVPRALATIDVVTGEPAKAINQRSDVTAVPAAGVVAEAMVALVLAEAAVEKFGGDSVAEMRRNVEGYLKAMVIS
jgi:chorismate synthase